MQEKSQKKSLVKQNILQVIEIKGITKYEFYKKTRITRGVLDQNNGMSEENIARFLAYFTDIDANWLVTGKGEMTKRKVQDQHVSSSLQNSQSAENQRKDNENNAIYSEKCIPLIPIEALAGLPVSDNTGITFVDCEHYIIPEFQKKGVEFMIRVSGSSMYPKYGNGDILACRRVHDILFFQWGKVYVIDSSQGALVKRVFKDESQDNILLVSDNMEKYPPFSFPKSDIRSLSIVLGVIRLE